MIEYRSGVWSCTMETVAAAMSFRTPMSVPSSIRESLLYLPSPSYHLCRIGRKVEIKSQLLVAEGV